MQEASAAKGQQKFYLLYGHGGAYNHGCEALAHCTIELLRRRSPGCHIALSTHFPGQDREFKIDADELIGKNEAGKNDADIYAPTLERITPNSVCIHVAGDAYCYPNWQRYAQMHKKALEVGATSIFWSCSLDPERIDEEMLGVLRSFHLITAREQITYTALLEHGLQNVVRVSDIAFTLQPEPADFAMNNYVVLNLSPLVMRKNPVSVMAFKKLVDYILTETEMNIALVPHVVMPVDNDYDALQALAPKANARVALVSDKLSARQYKHIVAKARFCVTARTHLAIAAYSSCVPVLAVGYNVKSSGIAADLGLADYVLQVDNLTDDAAIAAAFRWLVADESKIVGQLQSVMPAYVSNAINDHILRFL